VRPSEDESTDNEEAPTPRMSIFCIRPVLLPQNQEQVTENVAKTKASQFVTDIRYC
jgi:hypothetical protein